jgi:PKD repeat protein
MKIFAKSRTISLIVGLVLMILVLPGAVSAYTTSSLNAQVISTTVPSSMNAGQSYPVSITMKNTGTMSWNEESTIQLGGIGGDTGNAAQFGQYRMSIPAGISVDSGDQYRFTFTMTAPATPGNFTPKYRMIYDGYQWFGARVSRTIQVVSVKTAAAGIPPKAQFTSNVTKGSSPLYVQFTDQSTGTAPLTYHWDFSDGDGKLPENSQKNPLWRFWKEDGSSFTVTLTVTNAYGTDTIVKPNYITFGTPTAAVPAAAPVADFTANVQSGTAPLTVQFSDQTAATDITTYKWDVNNDGTTDYTTKSPSHTYTSAGNYTVKLSVTNASGTDTEIKTGYIVVSAAGIIPKPTPAPVTSITVTSPSGGETWQRGTTHTVSWEYTGNPGSTVKITRLQGGIEVGTISTSTSVGSDGKGSFTWSILPTGSTGSECKVRIQSIDQPDLTSTSSGYFTLVANTTPTPSATITPAKLPAAQFSATATQGKNPLVVQFTDTSVSTGTTSYKWDINNDGVVDYTVKNPIHTYQTAGTFTVKLTVTNASGSDSEIKTGYITVSSPSVVGSGGFGAESNPTGNPIGGGAGYSRIITGSEANVKYTVSTKAELLTALKSAKSGEIVFVKKSAVIDMTGTPTVTIPSGVTLASDRGLAGSSGALIKRTKNLNGGWEEPMFKTSGTKVRVTGLQLEGEMAPQDSTGAGESRYLVGVEAESATSFEVDNCELRGWSWAAVSLDRSTGSYIHHNYMHHNQAAGEGYGTCHYGGDAIVEANLYNYNRHDITGAGWAGEKYEFRYNIDLGYGTAAGGSRVDVHADENGGVFAGSRYDIHHNTFQDNGAGVLRMLPIEISEKPTTGAYISNNNFEGGTIAGGYYTVPIRQMAYSTFGKMYVTNNLWGSKVVPDSSIVMYELKE